MSTTTTTTRLQARLAMLREEEHRRWQDVLAAQPYTPGHVAAQGIWQQTCGQIIEVQRMMSMMREDE